MKLNRLIKMSMSSVYSNKIRSFLTMLGIIIGISSVIVLVGMGEGTKQKVASQIEQLGTNLITVNLTGGRSTSITNKDIDNLKTKPGIAGIAPALTSSVNIKGGNTTTTTNMTATTPNYSQIRKVNVSSGRFLSQTDVDNRYKVAVVGVDVANELYKTTDVIGYTINVNGVDFSIIGVLQQQGGGSSSGSNDDTIILPISTAQRLLKNTNIKTFYVEATDKDSMDTAMGYLQLFLNKKFNNDTKSYRVFNQTSLLDTANQTNDSMTALLSGVAAISLLVGGIGIMNIMLVSVIERTKEIGIRKAIGAKRKTILSQFLIEATFISGFGGILGVIFGYLGAYIMKTAFKTPVVIYNNVVIGSFLFSLFIGIVFGMYPANKASKLNPIEALRFE